MELTITPGGLKGGITVPGSKSHTIRALLMGTLARGTTKLRHPLRSQDTESCVGMCRALGADIDDSDDECWTVRGTAGRPHSGSTIDVGNSGTSLYLGMSVAALGRGETEFDGDEQLRRRSAAPLLASLRELGARAQSERGDGCAPLVVEGPLRGGVTTIECPTSQYLSSLLLGCPFAEGDSIITVNKLNEAPYVVMTLSWLDILGVDYEATDDLRRIIMPGAQKVSGFDRTIGADFSSATFFLVAAGVTGSRVKLQGLDPHDPQGDRAVVEMMEMMGCQVKWDETELVIEGPDRLSGASFDLNATPDALPAMAVAGAMAEGDTHLLNVPQAREKETDRIAVMTRELRKMGAEIEELPDGLVVRSCGLKGADVHGHSDHRVVMALAVAGLAAEGVTTVDTASAVAVTFPGFVDLMQSLGADMERDE
jgi:3-phosphoshikimate 1-carboxyvinyltransferase